ncbi:MAG: hypothetical protein AAGA28_09515 [Pseudomonadota bacterium]
MITDADRLTGSTKRDRLPAALAAATFLLAGQPVLADDATRNKFEEAYTLCLGEYGDASDIGPALVAAGFEHQPEQIDDTETLHWYVTPGEADVTVLLRTTPLERFCAISSETIGLADALQKAQDLTKQSYPDAMTLPGDMEGKNIQIGSPEGQNDSCSGFWAVLGDKVLWVSAGMAGQDPVCIDNGTSQIMVVM